jgi:hypothetical protein
MEIESNFLGSKSKNGVLEDGAIDTFYKANSVKLFINKKN